MNPSATSRAAAADFESDTAEFRGREMRLTAQNSGPVHSLEEDVCPKGPEETACINLRVV